MGSAADLMQKADQARNSARTLLAAGDADGACNRAYFSLFLTARACLIAADGTTGNEIGGDKGQVIHALRGLIDEPAVKKELFSAWIEAGDCRLQADLGQAVSAETAGSLLARIEALVASLKRRIPTDDRETAAKTALVLATDYSAIGHLKRARIGTRHEPLLPTLIRGVLPQAAPYFAGRAAPSLDEQTQTAFANLHWLEFGASSWRTAEAHWPGLRDLVAGHDRTELWVDPDPNSQLAMLFLLDYLGDDAETLWLYQSPTRLGGHPAEHSLTSVVPLRQVEPIDTAIASRIWHAYAAPAPEGVSAFLDTDPERFPLVSGALLALLRELPSLRDGLGATQRWMVQGLAEGAETTRDLFRAPFWEKQPSVYRPWEVEQILDDLCRCRRPAISGLQERPDTHGDLDRHRRFLESRLTLTDFGRDLLAGKADFAQENKIDRYWGGTRLTNDTLWRWDSERRRLKLSA